MSNYTLYSKDNCPACLLLKTKLDALGVIYNEVNVSKDDEARQWLIDQGYRSVPQMFQGMKNIPGGIPS